MTKNVKSFLLGVSFLASLLFMIFVAPIFLYAAISDSKAITEAHKIWGDFSRVAQARTWGDTNWTKQVGYISPGCESDFTIVGSGNNTWDAAFASLPADKGVTGTYKGILDFKVESPGVSVPPAISTQNIQGIVTAVQVSVDGKLIIPPSPTGAPELTNWAVNVIWDSTKVPDGFHVVCNLYIHADLSITRGAARMLTVKNTP